MTITAVVFFLYAFSVLCVAYAEPYTRSTSLSEIHTIEGNVERIDYRNDNGLITDAADKHYATMIRTEEGNTVLEEYYDSNGKPTEQPLGNYALFREFFDDGREFRVTYLGENRQPMLNKYGYATIVRSYNDEGRVETEHYYDIGLNPVLSTNDGYGSFRGYDEEGRNTLIIHLDEQDKPMIAGNGYAIIHRYYYEDGLFAGRVKEEFYCDTEDRPICLSLGQYGLFKCYDELGRTNILTYLDAYGEPTITLNGYTTVVRTFYNDDSIETERYFDQQGKPARGIAGQYGILKLNGKTVFLDSEGNPYFNLKNYLENNQNAVLLAVLVIVVLSSICGKRLNILLLLFYTSCIIYITIGQREGVNTGINFNPLWSYKQFLSSDQLRWEIVNNILLFIPLGTIMYKLFRKKTAIFSVMAFSFLIESIQYLSETGLCELDDLISNSVGGVLGYGVGVMLSGLMVLGSKYKMRRK